MIEDLADTIVDGLVCLLIILSWFICLVLGSIIGEDNLTQKLCAKQQYDFCEVIEQKPIYRLKEN